MAVNYVDSLKNTRLDAVTTAAGTTAVLEIYDSGSTTLLASIALANPIAPSASGGVLTLTMPQSDSSADDTGTAAEAKITDGTSDVLTGLTVGTSGTDITLDSVSIDAGQEVTINSASITHG